MLAIIRQIIRVAIRPITHIPTTLRKKRRYPAGPGIASSNIPPNSGINISGVNPIIETKPAAVPVIAIGTPPSSNKAKYIARIAKIAREANATFIIINGNNAGKPGMNAKTVNEAIRAINKIAIDFAIPILSEINPAISDAGGFIHIFPTLIAAAIVTLIEKISEEYEVNRSVPQ